MIEMASHVAARPAAVFATGTMVRRMVPGRAVPWFAAVSPERDQARAVASSKPRLPLRICAASRSERGHRRGVQAKAE